MNQFLRKLLVLSAFLASSLFLNATFANERPHSIKELVDQYYQMKDARQTMTRIASSKAPSNVNYCPPRGPSCIEAACDNLGRFGCDDVSEVKEVAEACRGNYDGSCLTSVCGKLGRFGCDDMHEVKQVARACVGNIDGSCFESVCRRAGPFDCDDFNEVQEVLRTCAGN